MQDRKLLIVGIDPGIKTAYAVLDIDGNLLQLNSSKQLNLNQIISQIVSIGKVVLVGTDKVKVPKLVDTFATKLGARVVNPQEDMKVDEKRGMIINFSIEDEHQGDALASALFAYKSTKPLLDKINIFAKENNKQGIKNRIKDLVITNKISIKSAVDSIEKEDEKHHKPKIIEKAYFERELTEEDFLNLYDKLKRYKTELKLIKKYNSKLKERINELEIVTKKPKILNTKNLIDFRENRIKFLEYKLKTKEKEIIRLHSLMRSLSHILSNINDYYILKKLDTLGINEFNFKNKFLNIKRNDILLVNNANIVSNDVVELLKDNVFIIVHKEPVSAKIQGTLPFVFISAKNLGIEEHKYFGFVEKKHFESEKGKINWVKKIVDDYKREKELSG